MIALCILWECIFSNWLTIRWWWFLLFLHLCYSIWMMPEHDENSSLMSIHEEKKKTEGSNVLDAFRSSTWNPKSINTQYSLLMHEEWGHLFYEVFSEPPGKWFFPKDKYRRKQGKEVMLHTNTLRQCCLFLYIVFSYKSLTKWFKLIYTLACRL